ncbi:PREDICTED: pyruvate dehydrogenase E1 component subunit alpha, mitochondrial-like [Dinoponera quadriceps]|uniref:Pyruvate dehydrogenase E1 component subunit alpha, mitochondrial-like n=1 Tax=Dinoponera quadriceps TaxID=609295 RepID=A0A6P3X062_DINQU|nr:PREDICTED: pyruvate dehydrogenase E1 component subunit alpha, mitochondrial-like [Dinoponera quadriceps]
MAVGIKMAMDKEDTLITAYRCHGFTVAFDIPTCAIFAELMVRKTGAFKGKGDSMHMYAPCFYGSDDIVGGQRWRGIAGSALRGLEHGEIVEYSSDLHMREQQIWHGYSRASTFCQHAALFTWRPHTGNKCKI